MCAVFSMKFIRMLCSATDRCAVCRHHSRLATRRAVALSDSATTRNWCGWCGAVLCGCRYRRSSRVWSTVGLELLKKIPSTVDTDWFAHGFLDSVTVRFLVTKHGLLAPEFDGVHWNEPLSYEWPLQKNRSFLLKIMRDFSLSQQNISRILTQHNLRRDRFTRSLVRNLQLISQ